MLSSRVLGSALRQASRRFASKSPAHGPPTVTYNDMPSPCGSWQTQYDSNQRKYNAHLILGVSTLVGTILFGKASGLIDLNFYAPSRPADIDSYK